MSVKRTVKDGFFTVAIGIAAGVATGIGVAIAIAFIAPVHPSALTCGKKQCNSAFRNSVRSSTLETYPISDVDSIRRLNASTAPRILLFG